MLGSLLGSGPCWPGTANIYTSKLQVYKQGVCIQIVRCLSCQTVARIYLEKFIWPWLSSASECGHGTVRPVPGHTDSSGTEFIHLCEGTNFHGPLALKHANAMVLLMALSYCCIAGGLSGEINPHFFTSRPWTGLGWEAVQPPCSEPFKTQLGEALSKLVWPQAVPTWSRRLDLGSFQPELFSGTALLFCESLSYPHWKTAACSGRGHSVSVRWLMFYSTIHNE